MKHLTLTVVFVLLGSLASVSYSQIPQIEREALIALYNATDGDNWFREGYGYFGSTWLGPPGTECTWERITCADGHVDWMGLGHSNLTGSLPAELVHLKYVYLMDFSHNKLSGRVDHIFYNDCPSPWETIPVGCLPNLTHLYLNNNQFIGPAPLVINQGSGMVSYIIDHNQFTGIPPKITASSASLGYNEFKCWARSDEWPWNGYRSGFAPHCIETFPKRHFSMGGNVNNHYGAFASHERHALLLLYHGTGGESWTNNDNWLGDKGSECTWYGVTCTDGIITGLYLNNNNLVGTLPNDIGDLIDLENLYLNNNKITGSLPATMGQLSKLEYLNLYDNQLSGSIPAEFGDLTNLKTLDLESNQLTGPIPTELENLTQLTRLALSSNTLEGSTPQWIVGMNIADLSLESAFITSNREALAALYSSAGGSNWTNKSNWMNNPGTECTWFGITCQDGNVTIIDLSGNNLTGSIPSKIGGSTNLTKLDLSSNQLSGSIPAEIGNLSNLTTLLLPNNQLSGSIPAEAGSLDNLTTLTLSNNKLSGAIPSELGLLLKMETLDISSNSLTDSIPTALGSLASLKSVNLSSNKLGGSIPSVLGNLSNLTSLNFSNNLLSSSVPAELGNLGNLTDFNLSNNQLGGTLPAQLGELSKLTSLNLSSNRFSGYAPEWLLQMGIEELLLEDAFASNYPPVISITGGDQTVSDSDELAGESVSLASTATDQDGRLVSTQWLVGDSEVGTGLTLTIALSNGATVVTFKATDNDGDSSTTTATITIYAPSYTVTDEWPSPYNGVTPDSSLGLAFNNIGVFSASDSIIYTCLRIFTDGLPGSAGGISEFDIGLTVVSLDEATVQITKYREFNTIGALNENVELPDCSGKFETTTSVYTDIIEVGDSVLDTTWSLIDPTNLILKLSSYQELTAD